MISIFSARTYSESVVVDERLPYFISWIWKSGNILFVINILAFILCWGPIAFGLDVIDPEPLPRSHETYTALVASVAVAAPLSIDLFLDMWASYWTSNYAIKNVGIPRIVLILSLWLPDLFFSSYILLTTSGVIGAYAGFYPVSSRIASSWLYCNRQLLWRSNITYNYRYLDWTYIELIGTLFITALQSRIIQNEIQIKEEMVKDGCGMEGLQTLSDVKEAVGISLDILNDLLSYEKLEAGIMVIEPIKFRASFLISDFMRPFVMQARRLEVDLQLPVEDSETFSLLRDTVFQITEDDSFAFETNSDSNVPISPGQTTKRELEEEMLKKRTEITQSS
eukprot:gene10818-22567_t